MQRLLFLEEKPFEKTQQGRSQLNCRPEWTLLREAAGSEIGTCLCYMSNWIVLPAHIKSRSGKVIEVLVVLHDVTGVFSRTTYKRIKRIKSKLSTWEEKSKSLILGAIITATRSGNWLFVISQRGIILSFECCADSTICSSLCTLPNEKMEAFFCFFWFKLHLCKRLLTEGLLTTMLTRLIPWA